MSENTEQPKPESSPVSSAKEPAAPAQPVAQVKADQPPAAQIKALWPSIHLVVEAEERSVERMNVVRETAQETPPPPPKTSEKTDK
jgi:hypothetical protein